MQRRGVLVTTGVLAGVSGVASAALLRDRWQAAAADAAVAALQSIDDLRGRFNADAGRPRLVLVLAPT
jgi:hypothetical protein